MTEYEKDCLAIRNFVMEKSQYKVKYENYKVDTPYDPNLAYDYLK